ncbi:hypothetical protein C7402_102561 [Paraburkholderia unamae]|uniref:Uncharacterized protein n=2 Tax=Paraburkholderia unamae TaxID=219649 RepID=A0ABX5KUB7_9BURK|nr:hypothetical protein C7402_102561 [Paraburkholderia unamae]CAG9274260.1 putative Methylmuconolactone methyl-isomerase [Paraburkholderia unamae]
MPGIAAYTQNRVDARLWSYPSEAAYECDGIVELEFEHEAAMAAAGETAVVREWLPADELKFLDGITLCRVEDGARQIRPGLLKVMIAAKLLDESESAIRRLQESLGLAGCVEWSTERVETTAHRESLGFEGDPPSVFASLWFAGEGDASRAFASGNWLKALESAVRRATAWQMDPLKIVG